MKNLKKSGTVNLYSVSKVVFKIMLSMNPYSMGTILNCQLLVFIVTKMLSEIYEILFQHKLQSKVVSQFIYVPRGPSKTNYFSPYTRSKTSKC